MSPICLRYYTWTDSFIHLVINVPDLANKMGGGPRVVVSTAAFHARVRGSVPDLGGLKETKMFLPHPRVKVSIVGSFRDREVACSASDRQGSNFESCVWRTVSSQSSHHPQEVLLAQFSLYVHKGGLKPDSLHFFANKMITACKAKGQYHIFCKVSRSCLWLSSAVLKAKIQLLSFGWARQSEWVYFDIYIYTLCKYHSRKKPEFGQCPALFA